MVLEDGKVKALVPVPVLVDAAGRAPKNEVIEDCWGWLAGAMAFEDELKSGVVAEGRAEGRDKENGVVEAKVELPGAEVLPLGAVLVEGNKLPPNPLVAGLGAKELVSEEEPKLLLVAGWDEPNMDGAAG